jgi:hypothetical protein
LRKKLGQLILRERKLLKWIKKELRGFSLQANYTDRAIAAGQRS